jgi:hypothetical protein
MAVAYTDQHEDMSYACRACVEYLGKRNPVRFPTIEEYRVALRQYPKPVWPTDEAVAKAKAAGTFELDYERASLANYIPRRGREP